MSIAHATFLKKLLEDVLQQNEKLTKKEESVNQIQENTIVSLGNNHSKFGQNTEGFGQRDLKKKKKSGAIQNNILKYV